MGGRVMQFAKAVLVWAVIPVKTGTQYTHMPLGSRFHGNDELDTLAEV
jgi:hypothetical protein